MDRRPARDLVAFDATRRACELMGWEYRLVGAPNPIVAANLRWLAGYRHPRHDVPGWPRRYGRRLLGRCHCWPVPARRGSDHGVAGVVSSVVAP
jgi:hypothetical protein